MPLPNQYQSRVLPTPAKVQVDPGLNPLAIAGRGVRELGEAGLQASDQLRAADYRAQQLDDAAREEVQRNARGQLLADRSAAFETMAAEVDSEILRLREAGGPDHEAKVAELIEKRSTDFMATVADPLVQDHFKAPLASLIGKAKVREQEWSIAQRGKALAANHDDYVAAVANRMSTSRPKAADVANEVTAVYATIDGYNVPAVAKEALKKDAFKRVTLGAAENLLRDDPKALLASIDAGDFNAIIDDKEKPIYRAKVEARINSLESAQRAAANAVLAEFKENVRVAVEDTTDGVTTDPTDLMKMAAKARTLGDESLAQDADKAAAMAKVNAGYGAASVQEIRAAQRDIETRDKAWRDDRLKVAAHEQLDRLAVKAEQKAAADPVGLFITQGGGQGLPQFDISDPAVMGRYFAVGEAAAKRFGTPVKYIPDEIAKPIRDGFAAAPATEKAQQIATLTAYGRNRGAGLMRQVAPAEPGYAALLDLTTMRDRAQGLALATEALNGWEQAKANPKLIDGNLMNVALGRQAETLALLPGPARAGVTEVAKGLYAARAAKAGIGNFDSRLFGEALQDALGRSGPTGGIGEAPNGKPMVLPRGATSGDVASLLAGSTGADLMDAAYGGHDAPTWGGQIMTPAQFKRLTPVLVADDNGAAVYAFRSDTGFVQSQKHPGQNFLLDLRALAHRAKR